MDESPLKKSDTSPMRRNRSYSMSQAIDIKNPDSSQATHSGPRRNSVYDSSSNWDAYGELDFPPKSPGAVSEEKLRRWCGQPQPDSFLEVDNLPPSIREGIARRRSSAAAKSALEQRLSASVVEFNGSSYLPLTKGHIMRLSPLDDDVNPVADVGLFKNLYVDEEINVVHADHVVAALGRVGEHCKELVVKATVRATATTPELDDFFVQKQGGVATGSDWVKVFKVLPNLQSVVIDSTSGASNLMLQNLVSVLEGGMGVAFEGKKAPSLIIF